MEKIIIALGGNALKTEKMGKTPDEQLQVVKATCKIIADIIAQGYEVVLVHGNGPQVGEIMKLPVPLDVAGAMSQGYIGYHIQQALSGELLKRNINKSVTSVVTQVLVDENDPRFKHPTKPIGEFFIESEAEKIGKTKKCVMREDAGRGFRQVVASPVPKEIIEIDVIRKIHEEAIVIAAGGGGIPVVRKKDGTLAGIEAVVDKDLAAELLAEELNADLLMILTGVVGVALNYGKKHEKFLSNLSLAEAEEYIREGHFAEGSMLPKIEAAVKFVKSKPGRKAIIGSLYEAGEVLKGKAGTLIGDY